MVAVFVEQVLEDVGIEAEIAGTLDAATRAARESTFAFALVDLNLNGQLSYPVVDICRARGLPAVIVSGYGAEALKPGYTDLPLLSKPFRIEALIAMAERFAGAPSPPTAASA